MNKTITLNNGVEMPLMGYGVWQDRRQARQGHRPNLPEIPDG